MVKAAVKLTGAYSDRSLQLLSLIEKKKLQINLRSPFPIKLFKKYLLTVHLEGKRLKNVSVAGNLRGDMLTHTFLSALGKTTRI